VINIWTKLFFRDTSLNLKKLHKKFKDEILKVRCDLDEHLQSINESANEISANYEYTCQLERNIEKLSERLDQIQMYLEMNSGMKFEQKKSFDVRKLNRKEQEVFLVIYTLEEEKGALTYDDIAQKLKISSHLAGNYVTALVEKGVPIIKRYLNSKAYLKLDPEFKTLQAKENILQLSLQEFF